MLVLTNGCLIDGTGRDTTQNASVIINGNRIDDAGSGIKYPENTEVIDVQNATIMPGFIDCHVHLGGFTIDKPGQAFGKVTFTSMLSFTWDYIRTYKHRRQLAIQNGVTTIRSAGDLHPHIITLRDNIASGKLTGPRIFAPGPTITAPGGHPASTIYKGNRYITENAIRQIDNVNVARDEVKKLAEEGVDWIKAIYSDINPMNINQKVPIFSFGVLEVLADEAHKNNLSIMVHTGRVREMVDAIRAGADSIEHGILPGGDSGEFNDKLIRSILESGACFVPTLAIAWAYKEIYPDFFFSIKSIVKRLYDAGVKIAAGTDSGTPGVVIGKGLHNELRLLVESGLSPMEAILAATRNAADTIGKINEIGTIEKGKLADLIVLQRNPLDEIGNTRSIRMVIKDGVVLINELDPD
jgi:imidazolonepropionase-like amidohydrolase